MSRTKAELLRELQLEDEDSLLDGDTPAWIISFLINVGLLLAMASIPMMQEIITPTGNVVMEQPEAEQEKPQEVLAAKEFVASEAVTSAEVGVGAQSDGRGEGQARGEAPNISDFAQIPTPSLNSIPDNTTTAEILSSSPMEVSLPTGMASAPNFSKHRIVMGGASGRGVSGAAGAIDVITQEIRSSLENRKTLVVWVFDNSPSLHAQRKEVVERFNRVYDELGVIEAAGDKSFKNHKDKPLLTAVLSFGKEVKLLTKQPTDNLTDIRKTIESMDLDRSGTEQTFSAVYMAADHYKKYSMVSEGENRRNVMIVLLTDEAGDDQDGLEPTIKLCRRYEMPVYVVGVPAPFGQKTSLMKWVDPDPNFDQSVQWGTVDQGPESFLPERLQLSFTGSKDEKDAMDSGFGPYSLSRLCYETGGIFFSMHPNRVQSGEVSKKDTSVMSAYMKFFFDQNVMRKYQPDYVSSDEYMRRLNNNKARAALVKAAQMSSIAELENPRLHFSKLSEAEFVTALNEAQKDAARLEPKILTLADVLAQGETDRPKETSLRWQAGYDLAMGRVLAVRVRTEAYNAMLAKAKTGLKPKDPKNNTWEIKAADSITVGSQLEKMGAKAKMYLQRVIDEHPGTPWALLAERELKTPMGWEWVDSYTPPPPPVKPGMGGNGGNPAAVNDALKMLQKPKPTRPPPKL